MKDDCIGIDVKYEGTFLYGKLEGKCVITIDNKDRLIAEFKDGKYFGKSTYYHDGYIYNYIGEGGSQYSYKTERVHGSFVRQDEAYYAPDGTPIMAMNIHDNPIF